MRLMKAFPTRILAGALIGSTALFCASALQAQSFTPLQRITGKVDESQLVTLKGNTHPAANTKNDVGRVSSDLSMTDLILVLSRDAAQQAAFEQFVSSQYDANSSNYHQWLTPEQVGENFGPSEADIATVSNWLTGHGFSVDEVTKDRMTIRFSGTASQVESAFHTEIHNLQVNGVSHIGNMSDPQIPTALGSVVVGVKALHDFHAHPLHHVGSTVTRDAASGKWKREAGATSASGTDSGKTALSREHPQFGITGTYDGSSYLVEDVAPYDFATIYNVLPLWNSGIDGTGQTIAIAGTSSIRTADVKTFRTAFGLPTTNTANTPILQSGNSKALTVCTASTSSGSSCTIDDQIENALDVEWSGAVAKNAQIVLVASYPASSSDDNLYDSEKYIVENVGTSSSPVYGVHVMNVSYGECELANGTAENVLYYNLWSQAATEGLAVFVASGDSGSASCDQGGDSNGVPYAAEYGLTVSGLTSTPYNTSVGGTDFNWCALPTSSSSAECTASPYWNSTNSSTTKASALGYVPEVPWNDTCTNPLALGYLKYFWSNVTTVTDEEEACNAFVNYESDLKQQGYSSYLYFVDTVGGSGGKSNCVVNDGSSTCSSSATTTGASNGSITLYKDGWPKPSWQTGVTGIPSDGVRDVPDVSFFASDGWLSSSAYLICVSDDSACTYSSKSEPTAQEVGGTSVATPAMAGVMALINQKAGAAQGNPNAELYKLAAKQSYSSCTAETIAANATGTNSCYFYDIDEYTIAMPCASGTTNCTVSHSGDSVGILSGYSATTGYDMATGLGSLNVANVVNGWPSSIGSTAATVTVAPASSSITTDQSLSLTVTVASSASGGTTPTGTVTLSGGGLTSQTEALSSGSYIFTIAAGGLSIGSDTLTVTYSGDTTYASETAQASVTVTGLVPTVTVTPAAASINSNTSLAVTVAVTGSSSHETYPTGSVTLAGGGYSSTQTLSSGSYTFTIPYNTFTSTETVTLTATYGGDSVYDAGYTGTANVAVTYVAVLTPTVTVTPASTTLDSNQSLNVKVAVSGSSTQETYPTGTVTLSSGSYSSTAQQLSSGAYTFTVPANTFLSSGITILTATYSGDADYTTQTGTANVTVTASVFSVAAAAITSLTAGASSGNTSTITLTALGGYTGTVALGCSLTSSPSGANSSYLPSCTLNTTSVSLSSSVTSGTAIATIATTAVTKSELSAPQLPGRRRSVFGAGSGALLAFVVLLGIPARRRGWRSMLGALLLLAALGSLAACGGSSTSTTTSGTTAGTYTFTVTATGNDVEKTAESATFQVTVTN
jgi:subtilase family serine protease